MIKIHIEAETVQELEHVTAILGDRFGTKSNPVIETTPRKEEDNISLPLSVPEMEDLSPQQVFNSQPLPTAEVAELTPQSIPTVSTQMPATSIPSVPPVNNAGTVDLEVDTNGVPWDSRIHAKTKTKTAKGVWKLKPGADKELVKQILASYQSVTNDSPVAIQSPVQGSGQALMTPAPVQTAAPIGFPEVLQIVTSDIANSVVPHGVNEKVLLSLGVGNMLELGAQSEKLPDFMSAWNAVKQYIASATNGLPQDFISNLEAYVCLNPNTQS